MPGFDPQQPYNELPGLPPRVELETRAVLKACVEARARLAELRQLEAAIPNPAMLVNTIPILEAQASSEIENVVTTTDRLFRFAQTREERPDPATREALRYRTALWQGYRSLERRPLGTATAVEICRTIKETDLNVRKVPGTRLANDRTSTIIYTPPEGEALLREKLADWERFLHEHEEYDPLVRMAVGHYQFEAIHPFTDGNGRTGRVLNLLYLVEQGLLGLPVLYLSGHINRTRDDYYRLLQAVTADECWEEWLLYIIEAVRSTAAWTTEKVRAIRALMDHTANYIQQHAPRAYSRELVEQLFAQPYCRIGDLVEADIAKRQTASTYLRKLCDMGILDETKIGREKLFIHPKLLHLLTRDDHAFAEYA